jgi:glycosyltransferase involved in cell wall biosynthesis
MHIGILKYQETPQLMGRHIASQQFIEALCKYKGTHQVTLICPEAITEEHLTTFLNEHPLDVLHYPGPDMYKAMDLKRLNPRPMVVTGITHSLGHAPFMEWLHMTKLSNPQASDALICTSPQAEEAVLQMQDPLGGPKLFTARGSLGINTAEFYRAPKDSCYTELLYIGRLCPYTKVDLVPLLEMVKRVIDTVNIKIRLTIAGSDNSGYSEVLLKKAKELGFLEDQIQIEINISEERKRVLYGKSDIFLAPSNNTQETFGLTILEANAAGLPVIAYDWSGYRSLIRDGENGFLIPTALKPRGTMAPYQYDAINQLHFSSCVEVDRFQFETKLLVLITNEIFRKQMSETAFKVAESYDWKHIIPEFISLWERLLGRASYSVSALKTLDYFKVFSHYATNGATLAKNNVMNFINDAKAEPFDEKKILLIDGKPVKPGPYLKVGKDVT